jgi:hypothetical protein
MRNCSGCCDVIPSVVSIWSRNSDEFHLEKPCARRIPGVDQDENPVIRMQPVKSLGSFLLHSSLHSCLPLHLHCCDRQDWSTKRSPHKRARAATRPRFWSIPFPKPGLSLLPARAAGLNHRPGMRRSRPVPASHCNWQFSRQSPEWRIGVKLHPPIPAKRRA